VIGSTHPSVKELTYYTEVIDRYVITSSTDIYGTITSVSQAFCDISGYTREELIGSNHNIVRHPDMPAAAFKEMWDMISAGKTWAGEVKNRKKNGGFYWVKAHIEPTFNARGEIVSYIAIRQDITDKKSVTTLEVLIKRIEMLMITDDLTGAYNRRFFNQKFPKVLEPDYRSNRWQAFLMIDADHFKQYNDTYGHNAGDHILKEITTVLQFTFQGADSFVFRLGGEEFGVLFAVTKKDDALVLASYARKMIYDSNMTHSGNIPFGRVTVSMGLMLLDPAQVYLEDDVYKTADVALYLAKKMGAIGSNLLRFYSLKLVSLRQ
jgi:diguanylate cyclase (GGDEF)-like protein/PAS domain S-box-containing protein